MNKLALSVVVPVYNEEKVVAQVINQLKQVVLSLSIESEIILVNDCSSDGTKAIIEKIDGVKVINHEKNKGYGASLKTGIKQSVYNWILITDADGTYPIESIPDLIKDAPDYDLIIGSREKDDCAIPFRRRHAKKFLNLFASYLAGQKIPDLNSGLRLFRKDIVLKYWDLFPNKFSFTSTLTMACASHGYAVKFTPINYYKRIGKSSIKPTDFFRFLKLILKLSLFFKPLKFFLPLSLGLFLIDIMLPMAWWLGMLGSFYDTTFTLLFATALQTLFFGLLAEIIINNK